MLRHRCALFAGGEECDGHLVCDPWNLCLPLVLEFWSSVQEMYCLLTLQFFAGMLTHHPAILRALDVSVVVNHLSAGSLSSICQCFPPERNLKFWDTTDSGPCSHRQEDASVTALEVEAAQLATQCMREWVRGAPQPPPRNRSVMALLPRSTTWK